VTVKRGPEVRSFGLVSLMLYVLRCRQAYMTVDIAIPLLSKLKANQSGSLA